MSTKNSYSPQEIRRILALHSQSGLSLGKFAAQQNLSKATVGRWVKKGIPPPRKATRKPLYQAVANEACSWALKQYDDGLVCSNTDLKEKALELAKGDNLPNFKASPCWIAKTKKNHRISLRAVTHTSQKTEFNDKDIDEQYEFHQSIVEMKMIHVHPSRIYNFDQTCMRVVDPKKKGLARTGARSVTAKHPSGTKTTFTVSLLCQADGTKLPAVVVFKATNKKTGVLSENIMNSLVAPPNIIVKSACKGWWTQALHRDFLEVYFPHSADQRFLFIDRYPVHKMPEFVETLEGRNVKQILIPGGQTGQHQPLDVGINKPFKGNYRDEYHKWRKSRKNEDATKRKNMKNPTRQDVINWVSVAWEKISVDCIKNSFVRSGIIDKSE